MIDPESLSDAQLAQDHLEGDLEAFPILVERYGPALIGYARRLTGSQQDAEEIAQETFLRFYQHLPKLTYDQPFKPWLFKVCTNLCRNHAKKKRDLLFSQLEKAEEGATEANSIVETIADEAPGPEFKFDRKIKIASVRKALEAIPKKYQVVLTLFYWEGLAYEDIAEVLSLPINTVRTHIRRGKEALYQSLSPA